MKRNTVRNTRLGGVGSNTLATTGQLLPLKYPKGILWHYLTPPAPRQISVPVGRVAAQYIIGWLSLFHKGLLNASVKNFCRENICKSHFRNLDYILNSIWLRYIDANQTACHQWCITCRMHLNVVLFKIYKTTLVCLFFHRPLLGMWKQYLSLPMTRVNPECECVLWSQHTFPIFPWFF